MLVQVLGETCVFLISTRGRGQIAQALDIILVGAAAALLVGALVIELVAQVQRRREQVDDLLRKYFGHAFVQNIGTALRGDDVEGCSIITDPAGEPGGMPSDAPPRFIGSEMFGALD